MGDPGLAVELDHPQLETGKVEPDRFPGKKVREGYRARRRFLAEGAVGGDLGDVDLSLTPELESSSCILGSPCLRQSW